MMDIFSKRSVDHSSSMIDQVLAKGSEILYDHYLVERLPVHATLQNVLIVKGIMDSQSYMPQKTRQIPKDNQPRRIQKDSLAGKSLHIKRIPNSASKIEPQPITNSKLQVRNRYFHKSYNHSDNKSPQAKNKSSIVTSSPFIQLKTIELAPEEIQMLKAEDAMRKKKHQEIAVQSEIKKKEMDQEKEKKQNLGKMVREYEELEHRKLRYTYDFDGKIIGCGPINNRTPLFSRSLCPELRIKLDEQHADKKEHFKHKNQKRDQSSERSNTTKSQMFNSVAFNSVHASKLNKALRGNNLGSDFVRNQTFNNNNKRQLSNINIIEMSDGAKLTELQTDLVIASDRKQPVTLRQFSQKVAKNRYKSFLQLNKTNMEIDDEFDAFYSPGDFKDSNAMTSTKLPSSMSGRTKKYTFRDIMSRENGAKPMTAAQPTRRPIESNRPKTTSHKLGRVIPNQSMMDILFQ